MNEAEVSLLPTFSKEAKLEIPSAAAVIFSVKEALFKCHYPLGKTMFYFEHAQIDAMTPSSLTGHILTQTSPGTPAGYKFKGAFETFQSNERDFVITLVTFSEPPS